MFTIVISEKGGAERRETFDKNEINVGRVQGNDLMLPKGNVSKHHARLLYRDARFIVTDLKSTNGTYVNGRKISQATIVREGDKIYIGDFVLRLETGQKPPGYVEDEPLSAPLAPAHVGPVSRDAVVPPAPVGVGPQGPNAVAPPSARGPMAGPGPATASHGSVPAIAQPERSSPRLSEPGVSPRLSEPGVSHYPLERDPDSENSVELRTPGARSSGPPRSPSQTERRARGSTMLLVEERSTPQRPAASTSFTPAGVARSVPPPRGAQREMTHRAGQRLALITLVDRVADVIDIAALKRSPVVGEEDAQSMERAVRQETKAMRDEGEVPDGLDLEQLGREALRELVGIGSIGPFLEDDETTEIHVLRPDCVLVSKDGLRTVAGASFTSEEAVARVVARLAHQSGEPLRPGELIVDRRLPRGAVLTAVGPPAAPGWVLHIRKPRRVEMSLGELVRLGAMSDEMALFLESAATVRANVLAVGSSPGVVASMVGALAAAAPPGERIAVLQRGTHEIALPHLHVVSLRLDEGTSRGAEAVRAAARLGLDRLVVTSLGGAAATATLEVIAEGSEGVLAGIAAPSLRHALARLASQVALAHAGSSADTASQAVGDSFDLAVDLQRTPRGRLRAVRIAELQGTSDGGIVARDLFVLTTNGAGEDTYVATGVAPRLSLDFAARKEDAQPSRPDAK
jgi:pilus assembly protein CpaF